VVSPIKRLRLNACQTESMCVIPGIAGRSIDAIAPAGGTWSLTVDVLQRSSTEPRVWHGRTPGHVGRDTKKIMGHTPIVATFTRAIERACQAPVATRPACSAALGTRHRGARSRLQVHEIGVRRSAFPPKRRFRIVAATMTI
jgi:hypothetical protein